MSATTLLLIALGVTALALFLTWRGWRGKRVGDHPFCRKCGFDLFGKPGDSDKCPECGAALSAKNAVVIGVRQRNAIALAFGVPLLLIGVVVAGAIGWGVYRNIDWQQHKPVTWLKWEAKGSDENAQIAALAELNRRLGAAQLSNEQVASIVEMGLRAQEDTSKAWLIKWGDFIETARVAGMVTDAQWRKYAEQAVSSNWLTFRTLPTIRPRQRVISQFSANPARVGRGSGLIAFVHQWSFVIDGKECPLPSAPVGALSVTCFTSGSIGGNWPEIREIIKQLPPGRHSGYVTARLRVTEGRPIYGSPMITIPPPPASRDPQVIQRWMQLQNQAIASQRALLAGRAETRRAAAQAAAEGTDGRPTYANVELKCPINFELLTGDDPPQQFGDDHTYQDTVDQILRDKK